MKAHLLRYHTTVRVKVRQYSESSKKAILKDDAHNGDTARFHCRASYFLQPDQLLVLDPEKMLLEVSFGGLNLLMQWSIGGIWRLGRLTAL